MSKDLMFCRVALKNWKNFANADVAIQDRTFLVGPNASGKSNFLDVFRFLRDLASAGGGFQESVGRRDGITAIRCLAARRYSDVEVLVELKNRDDTLTRLHLIKTSSAIPSCTRNAFPATERFSLNDPTMKIAMIRPDCPKPALNR